jgi:DNA-directed RNA polymerase specialized sigma24 family protein
MEGNFRGGKELLSLQLTAWYSNENNKHSLPIPGDTDRIMQLHYKEGKSFREIAKIVGKSISVVYNHHHRGLYEWKKLNRQQEKKMVQ